MLVPSVFSFTSQFFLALFFFFYLIFILIALLLFILPSVPIYIFLSFPLYFSFHFILFPLSLIHLHLLILLFPLTPDLFFSPLPRTHIHSEPDIFRKGGRGLMKEK